MILSKMITPRFHQEPLKRCQFFFSENQRRYEREGTTTQGEGGHHGVHVLYFAKRDQISRWN